MAFFLAPRVFSEVLYSPVHYCFFLSSKTTFLNSNSAIYSCFEFSIVLLFQTQTLDSDSENLNEDEESNVLEDTNKDIQKVIKLPRAAKNFLALYQQE